MNIAHKDEVAHYERVAAKHLTLSGKQDLLCEWERSGFYDTAYLKSLRKTINRIKAQLRAMGGME